MTDRHYRLRLSCTYKNDDNQLEKLIVENKTDDGWQVLDLNVRTGGFLLFINGLFSCQHLYMRANSAERGLVLESAVGEMKIEAGEFWGIKRADISFKVKLKSGKPSEDDIAYITERMKHCPVSSNLRSSTRVLNSVCFA